MPAATPSDHVPRGMLRQHEWRAKVDLLLYTTRPSSPSRSVKARIGRSRPNTPQPSARSRGGFGRPSFVVTGRLTIAGD